MNPISALSPQDHTRVFITNDYNDSTLSHRVLVNRTYPYGISRPDVQFLSLIGPSAEDIGKSSFRALALYSSSGSNNIHSINSLDDMQDTEYTDSEDLIQSFSELIQSRI
ncbi:hypothetical protein CU097_002290 [Rhizopus azygosporus]|nr:hypothetical protein CU097_002290 [Rhizopus azygosporus]